MLTRLTVRNFKKLGSIDIELGGAVVFIGPNNSGKTTALQAFALWDVGLRRWNEKRRGRVAPERRPGVTINRQDLIAIPVPDADLLWRNLHLRNLEIVNGKPRTSNVRIEIIVEGLTAGKVWKCGLEFDYANSESLYCRPLRSSDRADAPRMPVPEQAADVHVAFLPPMSGLAAVETRLDEGAIKVRIGEGRTADVLRNLCHLIVSGPDGDARWGRVSKRVGDLFGVQLDAPKYISARGEIEMTYRDGRTELDLSAAGRGLQQTLLLLAHMNVNPGSTLLLDEPDAHLEILRQRQTYQLLIEVAAETDSQVIAASHSEVVLNEAADRDMVIAFVGSPHRIDDRGQQVLKALKEIGFEQYLLAEQTGWVLYLEGSTDLAVLQAFAGRLGHPAASDLQRPNVKYVYDQPNSAISHFAAIKEGKADLIGFGLFDRLSRALPEPPAGLRLKTWTRYEIENYLAQPETLLAWAQAEGERRTGGPLFAVPWRTAMDRAISQVESALATLGRLQKPQDLKASDDYLRPVLSEFYRLIGVPGILDKSDYHILADYVPETAIDSEVVTVLDQIHDAASKARPTPSA